MYCKNWDKIKRNCYERDNYKCRVCGKKIKNPHAHHIIPRFISRDDDISNLMCVCAKCHKKLDNQWLRVGKTQHVMNELRINDCLGD